METDEKGEPKKDSEGEIVAEIREQLAADESFRTTHDTNQIKGLKDNF